MLVEQSFNPRGDNILKFPYVFLNTRLRLLRNLADLLVLEVLAMDLSLCLLLLTNLLPQLLYLFLLGFDRRENALNIRVELKKQFEGTYSRKS